MKKNQNSLRIAVTILFFIAVFAFCFSASATSVNGAVVTGRQDGVPADPNKYARIVFYEQGTQRMAGDPVFIENSSTDTSRVEYSVAVADGNYDMAIEKEGYLPFVVENFNVLPTYDSIDLPDAALIPGDLNIDRIIDINDFILSLRAFDLSGAFHLLRAFADINEDGVFNVEDLAVIKNAGRFGKTSAELSTIQFSEDYATILSDVRTAHYLIDDYNFVTRNTYNHSQLQSGWYYDNRGGMLKLTEEAPFNLVDISSAFGTRLVRYVTTTHGGTVTLETSARINSGSNGFYYEFTDTDGVVAYKLITENGYYYVISNGQKIQLPRAVSNSSLHYRITLDLDNKTSRTVIGGVDYGSFPFAGPAENIHRFVLGTTDEDIITVTPSYVRLYCNYAVNEQFTQLSSNGFPNDWTRSLTGNASAAVSSNEMRLNMGSSSNSSASVQKTFDAVSGNVCLEMLFMLPSLSNGANVKLMSDNTVAVSVKTLDGKLYAGATQVRDYYLANLWYLLRVEADTKTNTAVIKINGKILKTVDFENSVNMINKLQIDFSGSSGTSFRFDEVAVYVIPEISDYAPEPVVPAKNSDSYIGINMCSLWRNGDQWGWDNISPFDEIKPYLGYYDEGLPEVADWEIKFMAEHGIDFQSYCWYSSQANAPIKTTRLSAALHGGFMNAKHSDKMSFSLLWEAINATSPSSSAAFRNYFVPYWIEYFFTDPRYMVIDNQPIIQVFGFTQLERDFGSLANVAAELEYVRSECRKLGFDGAIFLACSSASTASELQYLKDMGFDGVQAYNWGKSGYDPTMTKNFINNQYNMNILHVVPTISTGFNNIAWGGVRSPNMTASDFADCMLWVKNTALPRNPAGSWKSKLAMISTWNEYGEGTYTMPSGLNGFGYMDGVRAAFTADPPHTDAVPTQNQLARLGYLYPQNRALIRPLQTDVNVYPTGVLQSWNYIINGSISTQWNYGNIRDMYASGTALHGTATNSDPHITMKNDVNIDISAVTYIKVRASAPAGNNIQVFFTTDSDSVWDEPKSITVSVLQEGMTDYYLPIGTKSEWTGTLKKLRLDPISTQNFFAIESISLLYNDTQSRFFINDTPAPLWQPPELKDGHYMISFLPDTGIQYYLNAYHEWDKQNKVLYLAANKHEVTFTMGSSSAIVDGVPTSIGCAPYLLDGIPMLPVDILADIFEYDIAFNGDRIDMTTPWKVYFDAVNGLSNDSWEFNLPGFAEGWTYMNATPIYTEPGALGGVAVITKSQTWDPIILSPALSIPQNQYSKVVVGMKHTLTNAPYSSTRLHYQLSSDRTWTAGKSVPGTPSVSQSSGNNYIEYTYDISSISGTITQIRIDPFDADGTFFIDYVRFVE